MKNSFTMTCLPYVTFDHLCEIGNEGETWNYNRRLNADDIMHRTQLGQRFLVPLCLEHNHRFMRPCEPHMRLVIERGDGPAIADVPMDYFTALPKAYFIKRGKSSVLMVVLDDDGNPIEVIQVGPPNQVNQAISLLVRETGRTELRELVLDQCLSAA